jgi:bifunctional non-homologous end joining protein LigD
MPQKKQKSPPDILKKARSKKFSSTLKPMLATLVNKPFDADGWLYEVKWDGYRALAFMNKGKIELRSRNDKSFNEKFYPLIPALQKWNINAVVDGEIVVVNEKGISDFGALQNWRSEADGDLCFYAFDILWMDGKDLTSLPLTNRKEILESVLTIGDPIRISRSFQESGPGFFDAAKQLGLEGVIAKRADSLYHPGERTRDWLKIKANKRQEVVIGGFTKNDGSGKPFSSLLVGVFENKELVYTGKIGTGFNVKMQKELLEKFRPLVISRSPFSYVPDINKPSRFRPDPPHATATWLKPTLVCEVSFTEMTSDGVMRHPSFEGMRSDKDAKDVVQEIPKPVEKIIKQKKGVANKLLSPAVKKSRKTLLNPTDETQVRKINGNDLKFTNLSKIYWPKEKITKRDLLNYYYQVAPYILPYLKDRPQSMNRHPDGINGESFYYKDVTGKAPAWVETFLYHSDADDRDRNYLVAKDEASLLYMASLGCIEMNPWHSRVKTEDYPDWCVIDLDPARNTFEQVIKAAQVTKKILDELGIPSYPKTSGSTGIHIYIPLAAKYTYEQSKEFARVIARLVHEQLPKFTSIERAVKDRKGKMYVDFLQNRPQATISAPYSVRPKPGAPVSMPLHWEEVKKGLKMTDHTILNALDRLKNEGDIFKPVLGKGIDLKKIVRQLSAGTAV